LILLFQENLVTLPAAKHRLRLAHMLVQLKVSSFGDSSNIIIFKMMIVTVR